MGFWKEALEYKTNKLQTKLENRLITSYRMVFAWKKDTIDLKYCGKEYREWRAFMWLDNASDIDILFYEPYARIIADFAKNEEYNPLTIGVFGLWGAGKST